MSVLDSIIEGVRLDEQARRLTNSELLDRISSAPAPRSAIEKLASRELSIIAEIKRSSPSKGELSDIPEPALLAETYELSAADPEIDEVAWVPYLDLKNRLRYDDEIKLLTKVPGLLGDLW